MAAKTDGKQALMHNWDTAFAIPCVEVNQAIVDKDSSPQNFDFTDKSISASGDFGPWQICMGGDGKKVRMCFDLSNLSLTIHSTKKQFSISSGHYVIEVSLHYIPHTDPGLKRQKKKRQSLVVKTVTDDVKTDPIVSHVSSSYSGGHGTLVKALLDLAIKNWCTENLDEFNHVFCVVDVNFGLEDGWSFLRPNYTSYAYIDRDTIDNSVFAVLTMTGNRTGENNDEIISPNAIPEGSKCGFLISQRRMIQDLMIPAICSMFPIDPADLQFSADGTSVALADQTTVDLKKVHHAGKTYQPELQKFSVESTGSILKIYSYSETVISEYFGVIAFCDATHFYTITLGSTRDKHGNKAPTLNFKEAQKAQIVQNTRRTKAGETQEWIDVAVVAVLAVCVTILTAGSGASIIAAVAGLLIGAIVLTPIIEGSVNTKTSPSMDMMISQAAHPIVWHGDKIFTLTDVQLNTALQLGGDLVDK